jgi:hypothetical protein
VFLFSLLPPIESLTLSPKIALSLYTQQRIVGSLPGTRVEGISKILSKSLLDLLINMCIVRVSRGDNFSFFYFKRPKKHLEPFLLSNFRK